MTFAIKRGSPYASQIYLDTLLDECLEYNGKVPSEVERRKVSIAQILLHSMKKYPHDELMANGATGQIFTNEQILKHSIQLARSLTAKAAPKERALVIMRNHQYTMTVYYGVIFSGVVPFMMDPNSTGYEISYFIKLTTPTFIFCDAENYENIKKSLRDLPNIKATVIVSEEEGQTRQFVKGFSDDIEGFIVPDSHPDNVVMMLPTSGSTGIPKAACMTQQGLVISLPIPWAICKKIPHPTKRMMILTTAQWMTFTMMTLACVVYRVPLLISPKIVNVENVLEMLEKYKPSWTFFGPPFASKLLPFLTKKHLASIETLILLGAPSTIKLKKALKEKLPPFATLSDGYGTTEAQGYICGSYGDAPIKSCGKVFNIFDYKIVDDDGNSLGLCQKGELLIKGDTLIKEYYKNEKSYKETFTEDGWLMTGDMFYIDENEQLTYEERTKFSFKYEGCHVSPEEVELVINSVPGVAESVVCATERGPAAAVVLLSTSTTTKEDIHEAVQTALSTHKHLHGGIAFVDTLPHTHSGKLHRRDCIQLMESLVRKGQCF